MSEALYERYKDALRRGHVAALKGRLAIALDAYAEAAALVPDRALPVVSLAGVLVRLERPTEALAAYDQALDLAPGDEVALRGRADLLAAGGDRRAAAVTMDRLVDVLERGGRFPEATDAARRGLELAESRSRRAAAGSLAARLREVPGDPVAAEALQRVLGVLDPRTATMATLGDVLIGGVEPAVGPAADGAAAAAETVAEPAAPDAAPAFDPIKSMAAVEAAVESGDPVVIREVALTAAAGHRAADQPYAAIEVCYLALGAAPDDPGLHLALAESYLDRGWRTLAADKLVLLARLAELTDDPTTRAHLCDLAARRLPEDARLLALCD